MTVTLIRHPSIKAPGVRLLNVPSCAWCASDLVDTDGNPRWEIFGRLDFVCYGGCRSRLVHHQVVGKKRVGRKR